MEAIEKLRSDIFPWVYIGCHVAALLAVIQWPRLRIKWLLIAYFAINLTVSAYFRFFDLYLHWQDGQFNSEVYDAFKIPNLMASIIDIAGTLLLVVFTVAFRGVLNEFCGPNTQQPAGGTSMSADSVRKSELKRLILAASAGDADAAKRLIAPFVAPEEKLLMHGISAKFGLFPTYDFYFLTDRRIGDLEITPFTGNLNVEVGYLQKMDAFVLSQPAFPLLLRLCLAALYLVLPVGSFSLMAALFGEGMGLPTPLVIMLGVIAAVGTMFLVAMAVNPAIKRAFLRLKKSGLWIKLQGSPIGVLIFADRDKFELLTSITRAMSDVKRQLDKIAS